MDYTGAETAADRATRLQWWTAARFGLFIHWGPVSLRGTEIGWSRGAQVPISEYDQLYRQFDPKRFNATEWVSLAKAAGMKYVVLTSKHHDGFCLWDSQCTDYDIMSTPFDRDVVKELAAACKRQQIVFCLYYSICDWRHPDYPLGSPGGKTQKAAPNMDRYVDYLRQQLGELLTRYGPLGVLWFDGEWEQPWSAARGQSLYWYVRSLQPSVIINNRVGAGRQDMAGTTAAGAFGGDYDTPEQRIGNFQNNRPWESCITLCQQWAWKPDDQMKSLQECLQALVYCAGGDGNLLLNVGPMPDGRIEPRQAERLRELGAWLKRYGRSIYETRGGPFKPGKWGASTYRGRQVFLHLFNVEGDTLALPPLPRRVLRTSVLTGGRAKVEQTDGGVSIRLAARRERPIDTIVRLDLDGPAGEIPAR